MSKPIDHFHLKSEHNIHLFRQPQDIDSIISFAVNISERYRYHLAILHGQYINDRASVLTGLGKAYSFPNYSGPNYERLSWDGAEDWLTDLSWLTKNSNDTFFKGFILLYTFPDNLFQGSMLDFAILLDIVENAATRLGNENYPFHLLIAPVEYKIELLLNLLRISDHLCPVCNNMCKI